MSISNAIIGLILFALAVAGAWRWYDNRVRAQSKNQMTETAARDVRETAECHLEAFKLRPRLTETDLEVQAAFMDICMEAPRQRPMRGAHITLVTSSIRFAGGRIEVGPWLSLADSSGFAFRCYSSPLHSNLPTNDGHDTRSLAHYLGHRNLQSTARYTALAPDRFKACWKG